MAGKTKQPIDLIISKGKKHLTKSEIKNRRKSEIIVNNLDINPPKYLSKKLKQEFNKIANILLDIGIMTELDEDCLAQYLISKENYLIFTKKLENELKKRNKKDGKYEKDKVLAVENYFSLQDRALKQCRAGASDLGLSISSRCKLIMPEKKEEKKENKFIKFKVM